MSLCALASAAMAATVSAQTLNQWWIGKEIELDPGFYGQLIDESQGWRIWKTETRDWAYCTALKAAEGVAPAEPFLKHLFGAGFPSILLERDYELGKYDQKKVRWRLHRSGGGGRVFYRVPGDRYTSEFQFAPRLDLEGQKIQVESTGYGYPAISEDARVNKGVIDLTGMTHAIELLDQCDAKYARSGPEKPAGKPE